MPGIEAEEGEGKSQRSEKNKSTDDAEISTWFRNGAIGDLRGNGVGDGDPGHEDEERKDEVVGGESDPGSVRGLFGGVLDEFLGARPIGNGAQEGGSADNPEHVEAAKGIEGNEAGGFGRCFRGSICRDLCRSFRNFGSGWWQAYPRLTGSDWSDGSSDGFIEG